MPHDTMSGVCRACAVCASEQAERVRNAAAWCVEVPADFNGEVEGTGGACVAGALRGGQVQRQCWGGGVRLKWHNRQGGTGGMRRCGACSRKRGVGHAQRQFAMDTIIILRRHPSQSAVWCRVQVW